MPFIELQSNSLAARGWLLHAAGFAVTVAFVAAIYVGVYGPLIQSQQALSRTARGCEAFLEREAEIHAEHADLTEKFAHTERRVAALRRRIPEAACEAEFLSELATLAQATGFHLHEYRPGKVQAVGQHHELEIQLSLQGSHESLCRFLYGMDSLDRFSRVKDLAIAPLPEAGDLYSGRLTVQIFFASPEATRDASANIVAQQ